MGTHMGNMVTYTYCAYAALYNGSKTKTVQRTSVYLLALVCENTLNETQ